MIKKYISYGLLGGIVVSLLFLGPVVVKPEIYMGPENFVSSEVTGYSIMILSMLCVFFGVRSHRNKWYPGNFSFGRGLWTGFRITIVACLVFYAANILLYEVISPDFLQNFLAHYKERLLSNAPTEADKVRVLQEFNQSAGIFGNPYLYGLLMAASTFFIGIIISLISALILRRSVTD